MIIKLLVIGKETETARSKTEECKNAKTSWEYSKKPPKVSLQMYLVCIACNKVLLVKIFRTLKAIGTK